MKFISKLQLLFDMSKLQECPICIMKINKTTRAPTVCPDPQCGYMCCRTCLQEYIITQRHDPKCMNCSKAFSRMFLQTIMPVSWIKTTFIRERQSILLERERSMIPDTMPWVEAETSARSMESEIDELTSKLDELRAQMTTIGGEISARRQTIIRLRDGEISSKSKAKKFIVKCPDCPAFVNKSGKCTSCGTRICMHCRDKLILEEGRDGTVDDIIIVNPPDNTPSVNQSRVHGDRDRDDHDDGERDGDRDDHDGDRDGDRDDHDSDRDDHDDRDDGERDPNIQYHICDKSTLATARMIEIDTKPCPKCGNRIHKIEGCDQMFDPHCGTAFSWKTGQIVTGVIHNPHYFQWQREHSGAVARQPGDVLCGGPPGMQDVYDALGWTPTTYDVNRALQSNLYGNGKGILWPTSKRASDNENLKFIQDIHSRWGLGNAGRILLHIQDVELPRLETTWDHTTNRSMRIKYILNELDEDVFSTELAQRERRMEKHREIQQIFDTFLQGGTDILRKFIAQFIGIDHSRPPSGEHTKKMVSLVKFMGAEKCVGSDRYWWSSYNETVRYKRRNVPINMMYIPSTSIVKQTFDELCALEKYCNDEFAKISKAWKLVAPVINITRDYVGVKTWHSV